MYDPENPLSKNPIAAKIVASGKDVDKSMKAFYGLVSQTIQPDGSTKQGPRIKHARIKAYSLARNEAHYRSVL